jgi:hypothetical protein|nr:MAG TPA: Protein of unknown function (DUF2829) [Caudoviricetes sp.]
MNFTEAIKAMQKGKICFRKLDPRIFFKIEGEYIYFKEKGCEWKLENVFEMSDYTAIDWEVFSKEYVETASIGDILLDDEEDRLMIVIDDEDCDYYTTMNENGYVETIDLECNCYEKVGEYTLVETVIRLLSMYRRDLKK